MTAPSSQSRAAPNTAVGSPATGAAPQKKQPKRSGGGFGLLTALTAAAAIVAAVLLNDAVPDALLTLAGGSAAPGGLFPRALPPLEASYPKVFPTHTVVGAVEREEWNPSKPVAAPLLAGGKAKVLSNTFVKDWAAMSKWDLYSAYFPARLPPVLTNIYRGATPYFGPLFRPHKPMYKQGPNVTKWHNPHEIVHMDTKTFFNRVSGRVPPTEPEDGKRTWLYYTGDLNAPFLSKDLEPWRELIPRPEGQRINVWVSDKGVTTHLHIDGFDNFFVQIQGTKRMLLFPPEQSVNSGFYPFTHPSFGQCHAHLPGTPTVAKYANEPSAYAPPNRALLAVARAVKAASLAAKRQVRLLQTAIGGAVSKALAALNLDAAASADPATRAAAAAAKATATGATAKDAEEASAEESFLSDMTAPYEPIYRTPKCNLTDTTYPSAATSQTMAGEAARIPAAKHLQGYEVLLNPGDLLYIPPNWMHYVETLTPSISVNFWTQARSQPRYDAAIRLVVSHAVHDWTLSQKRFAVALILNGLLTEPKISAAFPVLGKTDVARANKKFASHGTNIVDFDADDEDSDTVVKRFIKQHVLSRFEPLIANGEAAIKAATLDDCGFDSELSMPESNARSHAQLLQLVGLIPAEAAAEAMAQAELEDAGFDENGRRINPNSDAKITMDKVYRGLGELAVKIAKEFVQVPARERHVWVGNFAESLAYWASDPAGEQTATVLHCLANFKVDVSRN